MACLCNFNLKPFSTIHPKAGKRTLNKPVISNGFKKVILMETHLKGKYYLSSIYSQELSSFAPRRSHGDLNLTKRHSS